MKRPRLDTRLDWRDPQMPVIRTRKDGTVVEIPPDRVTKAMQMMLSASEVPNWRDDPTYNLQRKR